MRGKLSLVLAGLALVLLTTGMNGGCGVFPRSTLTTYYNPSWMPDGRIIAAREKLVQERGLWGTYPVEDKFHIVAITIDASNEVVKEEELFEMSQEKYLTGIAQEITCSPTGEMIGFIGGRGIYITDYSGNVISRITLESYSELPQYFDWSPDTTKIVYSNSSRELHVVNRDGANDIQIASSAEAVAWRVGEKIVFSFADSESSKIYTVNMDGSSKEVIAAVGTDPQISNLNKVVYGGYGLQVKQVDINGTNDQLLFDGYQRSTLKLSFDNTKIVGGDYSGSIGVSGIYVVNIDGTSAKKLK